VAKVCLLSGDTCQVPFQAGTAVKDFRDAVAASFKISTKLRIVFQGEALAVSESNGGVLCMGPYLTNLFHDQMHRDGKACTMGDHKIHDGASLQAVIVVYEVAESVKHLVFDLHWVYPASGQDFLDGSCLVYAGNKMLQVFDYDHNFGISGVTHSGDVPDDNKRGCVQRIDVDTEKLQPNVDRLVFVLSAWKSATIEHFRSPSVTIYDTSPEKELATYNITRAGKSQAVIMCCLKKNPEGSWTVLGAETFCSGNAKNYRGIQEAVVGCFKSGI
jgi:stress response protein SCP2